MNCPSAHAAMAFRRISSSLTLWHPFLALFQSYRRSAAASESKLAKEIVPVAIPQRKGDPITFSVDEEFSKVKIDKVSSLRPVFKKDGEWVMMPPAESLGLGLLLST